MKLDEISGVVETIIFESDGFYILNVSKIDNEDERFVVHIDRPKVHKGATMSFYGKWHHHPTHGLQFKSERAFEKKPDTPASLLKYLSSSLFPGVGPVIAKRIIKHFGDDVLEVFEERIEDLINVSGITEKKVDKIRQSWEDNKSTMESMKFLLQYDITTKLATKIHDIYGANCIKTIQRNPYQLIRDVEGVAFKKADEIALKIGVEQDCDERISAAVEYVLEQSDSDGHCFLTKEQIEKSVRQEVKVNVSEKIDRILFELEEAGVVISSPVISDNGDVGYYSHFLYHNERYCAIKVRELNKKIYSIDKNIMKTALDGYKNNAFNVADLSEEQEDSVVGIVSSGISVLTGGPGTGKTFTTRAVVNVLKALKIDFMLAAPTGRAAQRMKEVIGHEAKTIHRLLNWNPFEGGFVYNEDNPLETEFVIIDEASMLDINLAASLLRAIDKKCRILFVGDVDQLPPVGPGSFFKDLIDSEAVSIFKLNKIFRQAEQSQIVRYAHQINKGESPNISSPMVDNTVWKDGSDCLFIESGHQLESNPPKWSTLFYKITAKRMINRLYTETIPKYVGENVEVQVLTPMKSKGDVCAKELNTIIQSSKNPPGKGKSEVKVFDVVFRNGDRVIQTVNNYDLGVFNGDIGKIVYVDRKNIGCTIEFSADGTRKMVNYKKEDLKEIELAYAITVHKSQGSEFDCVIIPITTQNFNMLYRSLIYTALTRGKKMVVLVGEKKALSIAVQNIRPNNRQTMLKHLLKVNEEILL